MKIIGVTLDWLAYPTLAFEKSDGSRGWILPWRVLELRYAEYFPDGRGSWPRDPQTGEKLPRYEP